MSAGWARFPPGEAFEGDVGAEIHVLGIIEIDAVEELLGHASVCAGVRRGRRLSRGTVERWRAAIRPERGP